MKHVAFVGQEHYFKCSWPRKIPGYQTHEININFSPGDPSRYFKCYELNEKQKIDYWFFMRGEFVPEQVLEQLEGKKVWVSTEPIGREDIRKMFFGENRFFFHEHRKYFDYMTHYDETELYELKGNGFEVNLSFPLPVDTDTYKPIKTSKVWDAVFLGRGTFKRQALMGSIKHDFNVLHIDHGCYGKEAVRVYNMSRVGLNFNTQNFKQFPHRVMNMMACGLPIISEPLSHHNWIKEDYGKYFSFIKEPDGRKVYSALLDLLEDNTLTLEKRGQVMRRIVEKQFDAKTNWLNLINKLEG
jgi:hypothetical protein